MHKLKAIRLSKNLTLKELAEKSKLAYGYISDLENGKAKNPSLNTITRLARALEVDISELLSNE